MKRLLLAALVLSACSNGARREAASLASAVERYRHAENIQKPAEAATIASVACSDHDVCDAKAACLAMSEPTSKGLALKVEVEHGLKDLEAKRITPESPAAHALAQKLEDSSRLLEKGRAALPACDEKVLALRLKYAL